LGVNPIPPAQRVDSLLLYAGLSGNYSEYEKEDGIFGELREDWQLGATMRLNWSGLQVYNMDPFIQYGFNYSNSSLDLYDYVNHSVTIGLSKRF
jgi:Surface lipoprotein assembly modifier